VLAKTSQSLQARVKLFLKRNNKY